MVVNGQRTYSINFPDRTSNRVCSESDPAAHLVSFSFLLHTSSFTLAPTLQIRPLSASSQYEHWTLVRVVDASCRAFTLSVLHLHTLGDTDPSYNTRFSRALSRSRCRNDTYWLRRSLDQGQAKISTGYVLPSVASSPLRL